MRDGQRAVAEAGLTAVAGLPLTWQSLNTNDSGQARSPHQICDACSTGAGSRRPNESSE